MSEVEKLTNPEDLKQYSNLSRYCFFDREGWSDRMFRPESFRGTVYGCKEKGQLMSGVISHNMAFSYWGTGGIASSGIGCVVSDPAVRNEGQIREIMTGLLKDNYGDGKILSFLYPFSYRFYNKFGYGTLGEGVMYTFSPP
ncbi:MAG: GNAT family N-acetyltransferase [Spirochaetales bacterium]|nr:GNAT family N-acetyltransferase [Spirochaetales bacterium]